MPARQPGRKAQERAIPAPPWPNAIALHQGMIRMCRMYTIGHGCRMMRFGNRSHTVEEHMIEIGIASDNFRHDERGE